MLFHQKVFCLLFFLILSMFSSAQQKTLRHPTLLGINYSLNKYEGMDFRNAEGGIALNYIKGINNHFDYAIAVQGSFSNSAFKNYIPDNRKLLVQADYSVRSRIFNSTTWFQPYIQTGLGASTSNRRVGAFVLAGPGIQLIHKDIFLLINGQYRLSLTPKQNDHLFLSVGIAGIMNRPKSRVKKGLNPTVIAKPALDSDRDGILDSLDLCPYQPGLAIFGGCPDADGDGLPDKSDKCPTIYGYSRYEGCPIPDTDKDGIHDEVDSCKTVPGFERYKGCPVPDSDGDGLNNEQDSCIYESGLKENLGCPITIDKLGQQLDSIEQNIFFSTGSAILLPESFAALDKIVLLLKENPRLKLTIEGHTDNQGTVSSNQILSEKRARAVMNYLVSKGIDKLHLEAIGFGQTKPIAENSNEMGRAKNRRVELKLQNQIH